MFASADVLLQIGLRSPNLNQSALRLHLISFEVVTDPVGGLLVADGRIVGKGLQHHPFGVIARRRRQSDSLKCRLWSYFLS